MTTEQIIAWLAIEGWELRRNADTIGPTFVNIGRGLWFAHWAHVVHDLPSYPVDSGRPCISTAPPGQWKDLQREYLEAFIEQVVNQGEYK